MEKNAGFQRHEDSDCHKEAVTRFIVAPSSEYGDVIEMQSKKSAEDKAMNQRMLMKLLTSIQFLGNF